MLHKRQQNQRLQKELENLRKGLREAHARAATVHIGNSDHILPDSSVTGEPQFDREGLRAIGEDASTVKCKSEELEHQARRYAVLEEQYRILQTKQRDAQNKKRAMVLERKRRLLEQDPHLLQHADDDEYTLEDQAAIQVQRIVRGMQGRLHVQRLRPILNGAAVAIQGILRGHLGRSYASLKKKDNRAVTDIQRVWRGHVGRTALEIYGVEIENNRAAGAIQRIFRGCRDRVRAEHKRGFLKSAKLGSEVVGVKHLFHQDIVELAEAIDISLHEEGVAPRPSVVLGLLRVVALMLQENADSGAITIYSALGVQSAHNVGMVRRYTWVDAARLLRRSSKLLRRLRQVAEGPASKRPRMVHFSQAAVQTYTALRCDHKWNVVALGRIGSGAKACQQLLMWVDALQEVFAHQSEFVEDLGSDRISWIERARKSMRHLRHLELSRMVWEHGVTCLMQVLRELHNESVVGNKHGLPGNALSRRGDLRACVVECSLTILREREATLQNALARLSNEEEEAQRNDYARELFKMETLFEELRLADLNVLDKSRRLEDAKKASHDGIGADQAFLQLCLDELTMSEVNRREHWTSLEICRIQNARNSNRRGVKVDVWGDLRHQLRVVGEAEAASILAVENYNYSVEELNAAEVATPDSSSIPELTVLQERATKAQDLARVAKLQLDQMEEERENTEALATEAEVSFIDCFRSGFCRIRLSRQYHESQQKAAQPCLPRISVRNLTASA